MTKYVIQFTVQLEGDVKDLNMYRAIIAKDENELVARIKVLKRAFIIHYDEVWDMVKYWQIPEATPLEQMGIFHLSDNLTGWNNKIDYVDE